jgi:hypothetical protein
MVLRRARPRALLSRVLPGLLLGLLPALAVPGAAAAHGANGQPIPDAAYYRTELTAGQSLPAGVAARVDPAGEWLELVSTSRTDVVILGYTREPYLRLHSGVVEQNQLSPTTYINRSLFADSLPSGEPAKLAPAWHQIGTDGVARWHDHRIHWMGQSRPPMVQSDPTHPHLVGSWTVHATADGTPFTITGTLTWIGKPASGPSLPAWVWGLVGVVSGVAGFLLVSTVRTRRARSASPERELVSTP